MPRKPRRPNTVPLAELATAEALLADNVRKAQINGLVFGAMLKVMELAGLETGRAVDRPGSVLKLGRALHLMMPEHESNPQELKEAVAVGFATLGELFPYLPRADRIP